MALTTIFRGSPMKLYEYIDMHQKALVELEDMDLPAEVVEDTLNALVGDIEEKTKSVVAYMRNIGVDITAMKNAEREIKQRRQRLERREQWIESYVLHGMEVSEISVIETPYFAIKRQKNPPAVNVLDADEISDKYKTEVISYKIDKKKIKAALNDGKVVAGATLTQGWRLSVK